MTVPERNAPGTTVRAVLVACHPAPTAAVTLTTVVLAVALAVPSARTVGIGLAVLVGQLSVGWSNDALDARRDAAVGRTAKPTVAGQVTAEALLRLAVAALVVALGLSLLASSPAGAACHAVLLAAGWSYNAGVKATAFSLLPYAVGFGALPGFVTLALDPGRGPTWWLVTAAALLGVAAGLANAAPDVADDERTGVRGAVAAIGAVRARRAAGATVVAATAVALIGASVPAAVGWPLLVAVVLATLAGIVLADGHHLFTVVLGVAVADVVLLAGAARDKFGAG